MFDYLEKYNLSEEDAEEARVMLLKSMRKDPIRIKCLVRWENRRVRKRLCAFTNDAGFFNDLINDLLERGLIRSQGALKPFVVTERGMRCMKRGYVAYRKDNSAKRANIIASMALIVSILNIDEVRDAIKTVFQAIASLL